MCSTVYSILVYQVRFLELWLSYIEVFSPSNKIGTYPLQNAVRSPEPKSKRDILVSRYMGWMWFYSLQIPILSNPTFSLAKGRDIDSVHVGMV
jgi:hypothetical protein